MQCVVGTVRKEAFRMCVRVVTCVVIASSINLANSFVIN